MGMEKAEIHHSNNGWEPVYVEDNLALVSIGFMLNDANQAVIWRGPKKNSTNRWLMFLLISTLFNF
jgi:Mrp family chromosome partitioning ATPase